MTMTASLTPRGERMRETLLNTALTLFATHGYHETTMRDIAAAAGCSPGLTYRYFNSKEELVLALYERLATEFEAHVATLPRMPLAERFQRIMLLRFRQVEPYRKIYQAILGSALSPQNELGVLGEQTQELRAAAQHLFVQVAQGASDAPNAAQVLEVGQVLYAAHMCLVLFWLYDETPGYRATYELLELAYDGLRIGRPLLLVPPAAHALARLSRALTPVFGRI